MYKSILWRLLPLLTFHQISTFTFASSKNENLQCEYAVDEGQCQYESKESVMHPPCWYYLAESAVRNELGVYSGRNVHRGSVVGNPEIVIQLIDFLLEDLEILSPKIFKGQNTGGQYEAKQVHSVIPGLGMMSMKHQYLHNVVPFRADVDEGDLPRTTAEGAGAITHYHNFSFFAYDDILAGGELYLKGEGTKTNEVAGKKSIEWLRENGVCMDNIKPGRSKIKGAGRGAFASRSIAKGTVIAPAPLVHITNPTSLDFVRRKKGGAKVKSKQLLLNYCFGHQDSSLLFYPYGSVVNLINHDAELPNAIIRWSTMNHHGKGWVDGDGISIKELAIKNRTGLVLEFVATRLINPEEEIKIDYGKKWVEMWNIHKEAWTPPPFAEEYVPAFVMDDVAATIRTESEQIDHPYDNHLITTCFYSANMKLVPESASKEDKMTTIKWTVTKGLFQYPNLCPCRIISRDEIDETSLYTAIIKNHIGAPKDKQFKHIVTHIPRQAIRIMDDKYTSDQHLENAFRYPIGIPDEIFPKNWIDKN